MAADLLFFCMHINWPLWPRFRVKIILNFLHDNEVIRANLYAYKRILNRWPFMNKVYISSIVSQHVWSHAITRQLSIRRLIMAWRAGLYGDNCRCYYRSISYSIRCNSINIPSDSGDSTFQQFWMYFNHKHFLLTKQKDDINIQLKLSFLVYHLPYHNLNTAGWMLSTTTSSSAFMYIERNTFWPIRFEHESRVLKCVYFCS